MALEIERLYRTHGPMVLRRCRRLLKDEGKALDAMHDVFVEMLRRQDSLHDEAPAALLLTTATHVCLNKLRSEKRRPQAAAPRRDDEDDLLATIASFGPQGEAEGRTLARRILDRLFDREPESTRMIAVLHYIDRMTLQEVAAEVGLSVSGVRKRLRTLRERLPLDTGAAWPESEVLS